MKKSLAILAGAVFVMLLLFFAPNLLPSTTYSQFAPQDLILATTTSTADSGLLNDLNPLFEARFNARVHVLSLGTGAALRTGENGDADLVLVHARAAEDAFLSAGFGINRRDVMFNDFVVVGPRNDPAGIQGLRLASEAFAQIAATASRFVSRGDDSGTHQKELAIWAQSQGDPVGSWYLNVGRGMGDTLLQTNELGAYTLSDRGTFLALRDRLPNLQVLVEGPVKGGDKILLNPYGIMAVNPARFPVRNYALAMAYIGFITSPEAQQHIAEFTVGGEPLFFPDALDERPNFGQYLPLNQE